MISIAQLSIFLFCAPFAKLCIITDKPGKANADPLEGKTDAEFVYDFAPLKYDGSRASLERGIKAWAPWSSSLHNITVKPFSAKDVVVNTGLKISYTIGELENITDEKRFFLLVFHHSHLKFIGKIVSLDKAKAKKEKYLKNAEKLISIPIWESCKDYVVKKLPSGLVTEWISSRSYTVYKAWHSPGLGRYIIILEHRKIVYEKHSHFRFMSFTVVNGVQNINFVGGHMRTPLLAEFSAINFMMLGPEFIDGKWNDEAKATWKPRAVFLQDLRLGTGIETILKTIHEILPKLTSPLKEPYEYRIGYIPMNMPCPNDLNVDALFHQYAVDFYWLQVVITDQVEGRHVIALSLEYLNNRFFRIEQSEYLDYLTKEEYLDKLTENEPSALSENAQKPPHLLKQSSQSHLVTKLRRASLRITGSISEEQIRFA